MRSVRGPILFFWRIRAYANVGYFSVRVRKQEYVATTTQYFNPLMGTGNYSAHRIIWSWYTGRWWMGCYIWYSDEGTGRGPSPPRPLIAVPTTKCNSPSINGQCTNFILFDVHYNYLCPLIKTVANMVNCFQNCLSQYIVALKQAVLFTTLQHLPFAYVSGRSGWIQVSVYETYHTHILFF